MMKVPFLDLKAQLRTLEKDLKDAVGQVIDSTQYILGPQVAQLEEEIARYVGVRFAIGVSSGTDALLATLMALDIKPGDLVITTAYSFFATAGCIARLGATPIFLDIDPQSYNISVSELERWLQREAHRRHEVKAIIPVHLYGQCAEMDPILSIAEENSIPVIEDAAQAIGATYPASEGVLPAGSLGLASCFSFFPTKNLGGIGDGGMIVTNDQDLAAKIELIRGHGAKPKFHHSIVGGNFRLDPIQAAALHVKLAYLDKWNEQRQERAAYYDTYLMADGIQTPVATYGRGHHAYHQYVISVPERRDALQRFLAESGIGSSVYYPVPLHLQECFDDLGYEEGDLPNAECAARQTLALPIYPELTAKMQDYVIEQINSFND